MAIRKKEFLLTEGNQVTYIYRKQNQEYQEVINVSYDENGGGKVCHGSGGIVPLPAE